MVSMVNIISLRPPMRFPRLTALALLLLSAEPAVSPPRLLAALPPEVPRGVFSLGTAGVAMKDAALTNPDVTGMSLRYPWSDLEPTEGTYNWTFIDSEVARATAAGKQVL